VNHYASVAITDPDLSVAPARIGLTKKVLSAALIVLCAAVWSAPTAAEPPPWAPAWGYRAKHKGKNKHKVQQAYVPPFDIGLGNCNRELLGSLLGAVAGGTLLGFLMGGIIGRNMDEVDQNCVGQALEHAEDGQQIAWDNPQTGAQYQMVPTRTVQGSDGRYCREYTATSVVSGRDQQTYGRACRQPDGSWKLVN
jgi:surface antigen